MTTVLVGASSVEQLKQNLAYRKVSSFSDDELQQIEAILAGQP